MYEERIKVKDWLHNTSKVSNEYDFESCVDDFCHSTKGLGLSNPYMSGILTEYYDMEDWVDVCAVNDMSRLKETDQCPDWVQHVVELAKDCKAGHEVLCFYAWRDTPYVYMARHIVGECPKSEYKSKVMKTYKVRAAIELEFEFLSAEDVTKADMVSHVDSVAVDGAVEGITEHLCDYIDIDDCYDDVSMVEDSVKILSFTKNGKGVRK